MIVSIKLDEPDRKHSAAAKREIGLFLFFGASNAKFGIRYFTCAFCEKDLTRIAVMRNDLNARPTTRKKKCLYRAK